MTTLSRLSPEEIRLVQEKIERNGKAATDRVHALHEILQAAFPAATYTVDSKHDLLYFELENPKFVRPTLRIVLANPGRSGDEIVVDGWPSRLGLRLTHRPAPAPPRTVDAEEWVRMYSDRDDAQLDARAWTRVFEDLDVLRRAGELALDWCRKHPLQEEL